VEPSHGRCGPADYDVEDRGYDTPCWIWKQRPNGGGYGQFFASGVHHYAHVASYELAFGTVPDGHVVHHRCEQRICIRPDHLDCITRADHARVHAKISPEIAEEIQRATGSTRQIARRYGVSKTHAWLLRSASVDQ
jgi:hypothetical protein